MKNRRKEPTGMINLSSTGCVPLPGGLQTCAAVLIQLCHLIVHVIMIYLNSANWLSVPSNDFFHLRISF